MQWESTGGTWWAGMLLLALNLCTSYSLQGKGQRLREGDACWEWGSEGWDPLVVLFDTFSGSSLSLCPPQEANAEGSRARVLCMYPRLRPSWAVSVSEVGSDGAGGKLSPLQRPGHLL